MRGMIALTLLTGLSAPCWAQSPVKTCDNNAPPSGAATAPDPKSPASGTSPGTAGSTGWTGGTGGSFIGTTPKGPTEQSPTEHPPTASGLDPMNPATPDPKC
ncbi:hypothetical protein [Microvirga flavescens]|uniref:hypothetical protein n=1 Tax=Microvirga flavescens TaxID=2249811 RepID=UPI001300355E|nr:hypothetical protein [Microvirga flavescens]